MAGGPSAVEGLLVCGLPLVEGSGLSGGLPSSPCLDDHLYPF